MKEVMGLITLRLRVSPIFIFVVLMKRHGFTLVEIRVCWLDVEKLFEVIVFEKLTVAGCHEVPVRNGYGNMQVRGACSKL